MLFIGSRCLLSAAFQVLHFNTPDLITSDNIDGALAILFKDAHYNELGRNIGALAIIGCFLFIISLLQFRRALLKAK